MARPGWDDAGAAGSDPAAQVTPDSGEESAGGTGAKPEPKPSASACEPYREIIEVIDAAKGAGVEKVGIVTEGMKRAAGVNPAN